MPDNLIEPFTEGRNARLEGASPDSCRHYASSPNADAWHAGFAFEGPRPTDFVLHSVTHGRGYRVNVHHDKRYPARVAKLVYLVDYPRHGPAGAIRVEA